MSCTYTYNGVQYSRERLMTKLAIAPNFTENSIAFLKNKLGMNHNDIIIVNSLLSNNTLGRFKSDGKILLSVFADDSAVYHESFHRVYRMYLTPQERKGVVKQFKKRSNWQSKIEPYKKLYPTLSEDELIEEYLADEFSDYVLNDGKIKIDPVIKTVFDKLIDFIKKLLGISNKNIHDLYNDIVSGTFDTKPLPENLRYSKDADKVIINDTEYSSEIKNEFVQSVGRVFLDQIFKSGTIYDLINDTLNADKTALYNRSLGLVIQSIQSSNPKLASDILYDLQKKGDSYINNQFIAYMKTLGGEFELTYIEQAQEDATLDEGDANVEIGRQQDDANPQWVASFKVDPKTNMSKAIKLLLATFTDSSKVNSLGLYPQVRWTNVFNKISQHLAGIPTSDIMFHLSRLNEPWVPSLIEKLGGLNPDVKNIPYNTFRLRNEFIKTFAKTSNTYTILQVEDKTIKWFDANQNTKTDKKIREWNNDLVKAIQNQSSFEDWLNRVETELVNAKNPTENSFIELLGINVDDDLKEMPIVNGSTYLTMMKKIATLISENAKKKSFNNQNLPDFNKLFSESNFDVEGTLEHLAVAQGEYEDVVDLMVTSRGKRLYGISLNTHTTTVINTLNYISSQIDPDAPLVEKLSMIEHYLPDVLNYQTVEKTDKGYLVKSKWLNHILNGGTIKVVIVDGIKNQQGDEDDIASVDETDLLSTTLNMSVSGINLSIKHSDRSVYYGYKMEGDQIFDYQKIGASNPDQIVDYLTSVMQDQLSSEVRRANLKNIPMIQYFANNYKDSALFDLKNIQKLDPYSNDIRKMIRAKISEELNKYRQVLKKWDVDRIGISNDSLSRFNGNTDLLIASSFANQLLTHLEEVKVFLGDFTFFKNADDFYKRMSTTSGTGELLVNDEATNQYITQANDFSFTAVNPRTGEEESLKYDKIVDGTFSVITLHEKDNYQSPISSIKDHKSAIDGREVSQAVYLFEKNMLDDGVISPNEIKNLAEQYAKNYNNVNENDGQSWMNMFFFREYMIRLGQWSIEMQNLFVAELKILSAKSYSDLKNITVNIDGQQVPVFEWNNWKNGLFEPVHTLKSQYAGFTQSYIEYKNRINNSVTDFSERIRPYTIYKTSFHILWPSTIFGTNLAQMHHFMLKNKVDCVMMNSSNKSGAINVQQVFNQRKDDLNDDQKKVAEHGFNFYDQYGHFNDYVFEDDLGRELLDQSIAIANINSLKDQVKIGNKEKEEIRGSTQSLKILLSNLIVNGKPRFEGAQELVDRYRDIISKLVTKNVNELKEEFGYDNKIVTKLETLVDAIKKSAEERSNPVNIIEAIEGFLHDPYIETLPNKTKMENIFYSLITNRAIVFNRPGNSYPQVAATGFEPLGERTINDPSKMTISTQSDLKFYSIETDSDGNITKVNPAEIIIPIPFKWIPSILSRYKTTNIVEAVQLLNDDIARGKVDTDVTFKGLRIPNQQLSSNDIVKVKKFALPTNNNFVVVPSEIVTKVGADFDIDKLNIYWQGKNSLFNINEDSDFNDLLEIEKEILLHPRNAHLLFMPVIDDLLKNDARAEIIGKLKGQPLKDPTTFFEALTPHKNVEKGLTFVKSKFGVGIVALDITGHAVFMSDNINISPTYNNLNNEGAVTPTQLLFEGMQNNYSLTSMYDASGRIISEVQSQTMNSQVDAGKDPYAVGLGINNQTLNLILYLNRRGLPIITALKFVNQPLIQQYLEAQRFNESVVNKQRGDELSKNELIENIYTENKLTRPLLNRNQIISDKDLNLGISSGAIDAKQAQFFEYFLALVDEVSAFNDLKNSMTVDTKGKKDKAAVENAEKLNEKVEAASIISPKDLTKLREDGILSSFYKAQELYSDFYSPMYAVDKSSFGPALRDFKDMLVDRQKGQYMKDKVRTTIENDFMVFLIQNFHDDFSIDDFNLIFGFSDEDSIAKQIQSLQKSKYNNNPVIRALFPLLSVAKDNNQEKLFDAMRLFERELNTIDVNDFIDAMKDVKDDLGESLYRSIIRLSIYQAGFVNSPFSLNKIIPTFETTKREDGKLKEFTNDYLREIQTSVIKVLPKIESNPSIFNAFTALFYMNNPQFLPKRYWARSPIKYFYLWNKQEGRRILKYINGNTNVELQPLGNTYFKRYFMELVPNVDLNPETNIQSNTQRPITISIKIISGGQTGIDELGLEVAKSLGLETGGTATKGFKQESSNKPELRNLYGLEEISDEAQADYTRRTGKNDPYTGRTELNVRNSDGTVYFNFADDERGLIATQRAAKEWGKPFKANPTVSELKTWLNENNIRVLNIAGNRGSKLSAEDIKYVRELLQEVLSNPLSQQLDLFTGLSEPSSSMEDHIFTPEELKEAEDKKNECKTGIKPITK